jgi:hypothetical protein
MAASPSQPHSTYLASGAAKVGISSDFSERTPARAGGAELLIAERPYGTYTRRVFPGETLDADKIAADYAAGVLTLTIPVREAAKPRNIQVSSRDRPDRRTASTVQTPRAGCCCAPASAAPAWTAIARSSANRWSIRLTVRAGLVSACRQPVRAEPPAPCTISHSAAEPVDDSPGMSTPGAGGFLAVSAPARPQSPGDTPTSLASFITVRAVRS